MDADLHAMVAVLQNWVLGLRNGDEARARAAWVDEGMLLGAQGPRAAGRCSMVCTLCHRDGGPVLELLSYVRISPDLARLAVTDRRAVRTDGQCPFVPSVVVMRRDRPADGSAEGAWRICLVAPVGEDEAVPSVGDPAVVAHAASITPLRRRPDDPRFARVSGAAGDPIARRPRA